MNVSIAIIDLNNGQTNQGITGIKDSLTQYESKTNITFIIKVFALRDKGEIPDLTFDLYISSGGPGSPYEGVDKQWENDFFNLLDQIDIHNSNHKKKKFAFLICHSFQLACRKYNLARITRRKFTAFGVLPICLTNAGLTEPVFSGLSNPFYAVDSRNWQAVDPNTDQLAALNAKILAVEGLPATPNAEPCIMAIRFSEEVIGTQFHPEANPDGIAMYLKKPDKKKLIETNYGVEVYQNMVDNVVHPENITLTKNNVLPNFLDRAIHSLKNESAYNNV